MPGWRDLIVCDGTQVKCDYFKLVELVQVLIHDLVLLSTLIAAAVFAYAGFKMLFSGGSETEYKKALTMFKKVGIGYLWILSAWLIVYTISGALLSDGFTLLDAPGLK